MNFNMSYKISKSQKQKQSILYAAGYIHNIISDTDNKVFAVSSTLDNFNMRKFIITQISKNMSETYSCKVLNCFCSLENGSKPEYINKNSVDSVINVNLKNLSNVLDENRDKYDVIFVLLEPVNIFAQSLNCARLCDSAIMIERYLYSKYKEFEKSLMYFAENNINVSGVITYI